MNASSNEGYKWFLFNFSLPLTSDLPACGQRLQWDGGLGKVSWWYLVIAVIIHIYPQAAGPGQGWS